MDIKIGGAAPATVPVERLSALIWGPSGVGKTTLACTMPGRKALINFDPDGPSSVAGFPDVTVFDLSGSTDSIAATFKNHDAFGLEKTMDHFDTFLIDSLTTIAERTLARGIDITKGATVERPSPGAYMARNNLIITLVRDVLQVTAKHKKNVAFLAHEGAPQTNDDGVMLGITMSLGGQLPSQTALRINECWCMFEDGKNNKNIIIRKARMREPVKSRMFDSMTSPEFIWKFNTNNFEDKANLTIDLCYRLWQANGFKKIPLPGSAAFDNMRKQYNV